MKRMYAFKKGSSIVEAAIVFPFVILLVLVIVTITIWFYEEEVAIVGLHINLWNQAQIESSTGEDNKALNTYAPSDSYGNEVFYLEKDSYIKLGIPFMKINGFVNLIHDRNGFFPFLSEKTFQGQIYIINEMGYIRWYDSMTKEE